MENRSAGNDKKTLAVESVLERLGGDKELLGEVVELFLAEVPEILTQLKKSLEAEDWKSAAKLAHTLKGSSSNVGAEKFAHLALILETESKEQDIEGAFRVYRQLNDEYLAVRQFVSDPGWIGK